MKKLSKLFIVVLASMLVSMFSGCALLEMLKDLAGPQNKWCNYELPYEFQDKEGNKQTIYLDCYLLYSDTGYKNTTILKKEYQELPAGLTIVVQPSTKSSEKTELIQALFGPTATSTSYFLITMDKGSKQQVENPDAEASEEDSKEKLKGFLINQTSWALLYSCVSFDVLSKPPVVLTRNTYTPISELTGDLTIKKVLYKLAIYKLEKLLTEDVSKN